MGQPSQSDTTCVQFLSQTAFQVTARRTESGIKLCIEDDGPGIPEGARNEALRSGSRLDTSVRGSGLDLSISVDLLAAYGGKLELKTSERVGGLACEVTLRTRTKRSAYCASGHDAASSYLLSSSVLTPNQALTRTKRRVPMSLGDPSVSGDQGRVPAQTGHLADYLYAAVVAQVRSRKAASRRL